MRPVVVDDEEVFQEDCSNQEAADGPSRMVSSAKVENMVVQSSVAAVLAAEQDAHVEGSTIIVGAAGQALGMNNSGAMILAAGQDLKVTNGGAAAIFAGGDVAVKNGGAFLLVAKHDVNLHNDESQSVVLVTGRNVLTRGGSTGVVVAGNAVIDDDAHILVELSPKKFVKAVITLVALPFAAASLLSKQLIKTSTGSAQTDE